jgi:hypothetical protein
MKELDIYEIESIDTMLDEEAAAEGMTREEYEFQSRFDAEYEKNQLAMEEIDEMDFA